MYVLADSYVFIAETASQCKHRKYIPPIPILPYPALSLPTHCHSRHLIPPIPSHPKPSQTNKTSPHLSTHLVTPPQHRLVTPFWRVVSGDSKRDSQVLQPNHIPPLIPPQLHQLNPVPLQWRANHLYPPTCTAPSPIPTPHHPSHPTHHTTPITPHHTSAGVSSNYLLVVFMRDSVTLGRRWSLLRWNALGMRTTRS